MSISRLDSESPVFSVATVKFNCPKCKRRIEAEDSVAETAVSCPKCSAVFKAPPIPDEGLVSEQRRIRERKKHRQQLAMGLSVIFAVSVILGILYFLDIPPFQERQHASFQTVRHESVGRKDFQGEPNASFNVPNDQNRIRELLGSNPRKSGAKPPWESNPRTSTAKLPSESKPSDLLTEEEIEGWEKISLMNEAKGQEDGAKFAYQYGRVPTKLEYAQIQLYSDHEAPPFEDMGMPDTPENREHYRKLIESFEAYWRGYENGCKNALDAFREMNEPAFR